MDGLRVSEPDGLSQIIDYFEKPENHLDNDKKHISQKEFKSAIGKISKEADAYLRAIVESDHGYYYMRDLQNEKWKGLCTDEQVSMRDMYAARRGLGYHNEKIDLSGVIAIRKLAKLLEQIKEDDPINIFIENQNNPMNTYNEDAGPEIRAILSCSGKEALQRYAALRDCNFNTASGTYVGSSIPIAQIRAALAIGGDDAIQRFKQLRDSKFKTGGMDIDIIAKIRALLAIAGEDAIQRFTQLKPFNLRYVSEDTEARIRCSLAIAGEDAIQRFINLKPFNLRYVSEDTEAQIRSSLAIAGEDAVLRFKQLINSHFDTGLTEDYPDTNTRIISLLSCAGETAVQRFIELRDSNFAVYANNDEVRAEIMAKLAIAGPDAIERFKLIRDTGEFPVETKTLPAAAYTKYLLAVGKSHGFPELVIGKTDSGGGILDFIILGGAVYLFTKD